MLIAVVLNYFVPAQVFTWVTSVAVVGALWTWGIIMVAHANYRRAIERGEATTVSYRMPGAPYVNWIVVAFLVTVSGMLWLDPGTRVALFVAPIWIGLLCLGYAITTRRTAR
jgi:AAT family amino acid transporter/D-serine/D-alanine/glycine transporter